MKKIVFLAPYPTNENIKEGMMQRVAAVDAMFSSSEWSKSYVVPSFKKFKNTQHKVAENVVQYNLSIWTGRKQVLQLLNQADVVYCHSLYGISMCGLLYWRSVQCRNIIWDVHGIIPEELRFAGKRWLKIKLFERLEGMVVGNVDKITVVTHAMQEHLQSKYPDCHAKFYTYAILPLTIEMQKVHCNSDNQDVVLLYAGNTQKYQNIPLMAKNIASLVDRAGISFEILTGAPEEMRAIFTQYGLNDKHNVHINSVKPSELDAYYSQAHYGYVLRDDIDVNRVACPTKIVEYLAYGLRPIVIQPRIGDFAEMGYEYVGIEELRSISLENTKSTQNAAIYHKLVENSDARCYKTFIEQP